MKCELNIYVCDCEECGFCEDKRKIEREEALKAIRTIKECCEQTSNDDCGSGDCIIYDWCKKDRNHAPTLWEEGEPWKK